MSAFERYFYGPFAASRAYLFCRAFLVVVALDTWMLMIGHAGRYGVVGAQPYEALEALVQKAAQGGESAR